MNQFHLAALACSASLSVACVAQTESNQSAPARQSTDLTAAADQNAQLRITVERRDATVEVRVESATPFQDHAMPPVLVIGDSAFSRSRHPPDGQANVLIFTIDRGEYDALPDTAEVSVGYLSPSAKLGSGRSLARSAGGSAFPRVEPSQVQSGRRRAGVLDKRRQEVTP